MHWHCIAFLSSNNAQLAHSSRRTCCNMHACMHSYVKVCVLDCAAVSNFTGIQEKIPQLWGHYLFKLATVSHDYSLTLFRRFKILYNRVRLPTQRPRVKVLFLSFVFCLPSFIVFVLVFRALDNQYLWQCLALYNNNNNNNSVGADDGDGPTLCLW